MAERKDVVKTLAAVFAVQTERYDDHNYPYQHTESLWGDHLRACEVIRDTRGNDKRRIVLRHLQVLSSGRVVWQDVKTVWEAGKWVSPEHDPRASDPEFRKYLRLKEKFDN